MDVLAQRFETNRPHLEAVAYRVLGSRTEADDVLQVASIEMIGDPERLARLALVPESGVE